ncbi:MAG TPA: alkaline phosphatase family protein, partial [Anaerolineales bacterium]
MKSSLRIILGVLVCLLLAAGAYFWATGLLDSLYAYRSPLHSQPPAPGAAIGTPAARRVVFVLIDALRNDTSLKPDVMPFLNELRQNAAFATMHSRPPSYSEPGYSVLLTGAWPDLSDGPTINLDYDQIPTWTQDNLFSAAHRAGIKTAVSGYYWFEKLIPQSAVDLSFYTPGEDKVADRQVVDAALPWLRQDSAQLVLIHIDQVDYAGHHEGGPIDPRWDAAARRADDLLREIAATLDLSKDVLFVCSDHGQIDRGGHGGQDPITLIEPFVLAGAGIQPGQYPDVQMVDVAPTLAALLGTNIPAT